MNTIMKDHRQEVFRTLAADSPPPQQLLNRQKTTNSFKNLANVEQIEVEQLSSQGANDIYQFTSSSNKTSSIKKQLMDSLRDRDQLSDFGEEATKSKTISFMDKPQSKIINTTFKQPDTPSKPKQLNALNTNSNSTNKLTKQKTEMVSSQANLIRNLQSESMITTKLSVDKKDKEKDKDKKKKEKKSKSKKDKDSSKKQHSSAVNIHSIENNLMNDMFRVNEQNTAKLNHKMNRQETNVKPIIKKSYSNLVKSDKLLTPEKEDPETIRWKFELEDPIEEQKRIDVYKQNRRSRYIDQRNKQLRLHNGSTTSILPYMYYDTPAPKPEEEESIDEAIHVESKENFLETTLTKSIHRLSSSSFKYETSSQKSGLNIDNTISDHNTSSTVNESTSKDTTACDTSNDNTKLKEKCSNVTTDSAISSLSSSSR